MNNRYDTLMTIPSPCGLAITSVTSDGNYLYALQPDRKTVYKLDACGRILCTFKTGRKFLSIHYCGTKFYAVAEGDGRRIYILSSCFNEQGFIEPSLSESTCYPSGSSCISPATELLFIGPSGDCRSSDCMLSIANRTSSYIATVQGRIISKISDSGRNLYYTAIAENSGVLYEGLESSISSQTFIRATLLSSGQTKVQRLPFGYRVRGFFCYGGVLYAFITKNSFHAYIAAICTFVSGGVLGGEIISLPESPYETSCCDESCNFGPKNSKCNCFSGCSTCSQVSSNSTDFCDDAVSGDSTENGECDINELCRLYNCLKLLCKDTAVSGSSCGCTNTQGACCNSGNLSCTRFPQCCCNEGSVGGDSCLPLPTCPPYVPCDPSVQSAGCNCNQ